MKTEFFLAFNEIAETRKLPREVVLEALEAALVSAYRRAVGIGSNQQVEARIDERTGTTTIWAEKEVVEDVENEMTEVSLDIAGIHYDDVALGDLVLVESTPDDFGRIAAQTAKQVILQRMREAERDAQYEEYQDRIGDLITGTVQSTAGGVVTIGLGRSEAIMPRNQQVPGERYRTHDRVRAYVMDVKRSNRGPQIVVSRTHRNMLRRLLEYEVPEIYNGAVEIMSIAREPGARSKVAVAAIQEGADPVGACVGMRGVRIQSIVKELNGEKIDVIEWNPDQNAFIAKALSPARVNSVYLDDDPDEGRTAIVVVPDDQLSLAIGREGQNARLAAKLTGWRIDIKSTTEAASDAYRRIMELPELEELAAVNEEIVERVGHIMEKKEQARPIMPEDYQSLVRFTELVENHRLGLREAERSVRREEIETARDQVPSLAYEHPLDDTDLPLRVYNALDEAGYATVGEVMEQYYLSQDRLLEISGFGPAALESVQDMIDTMVFEEAPAPVEDETAETVGVELLEEADAEAVGIDQQDPEAAPPADGDEIAPTEWVDDEEIARQRRAELVSRMMGRSDEAPVDEVAEVVEVEVADEQGDLVEDAVPTDELTEGSDDLSEEDSVEEFDFDDEDETETRDSKERRRQLIFDEDSGRVVSHRRRKPGRSRDDWEDFID